MTSHTTDISGYLLLTQLVMRESGSARVQGKGREKQREREINESTGLMTKKEVPNLKF